MILYGCKFCICPGFKLSPDEESAAAHVREVHQYPQRSAREILRDRDPDQARVASKIIDETGPRCQDPRRTEEQW